VEKTDKYISPSVAGFTTNGLRDTCGGGGTQTKGYYKSIKEIK
jgi:hypothetical protein